MAQTKCISANATKNNGAATIAQAGNVPSSNGLTNDLSMAELKSVNQSKYGSAVYKAVSAASSGNVGTGLSYSAGTFSSFQKNQYIMMVAGTHISGAATDRFKSPANRVNNRPFNLIKTTHTVYVTAMTWTGGRDGGPTYSFTKTASAPDFGVDHETTTLGEFVYRTGKPLPTQADYPTPYSN